MNGFYAQVIAALKEHQFRLIRQGKGSHELWGNGQITVTVSKNCDSRFTAIAIMKQARITTYRF